jgi:hypothetical protein
MLPPGGGAVPPVPGSFVRAVFLTTEDLSSELHPAGVLAGEIDCREAEMPMLEGPDGAFYFCPFTAAVTSSMR